MFKFRGFKASFNLLTGKKKSKDEKPSDVPVFGAYRGYGEGYFGTNSYTKQPTETSTAKSSKLEHTRGIKSSKSTSDLARQNDKPKDTRKSTSDLPSSSTVRNGEKLKNSHKQQNKLEEQKSVEQNMRTVSSHDYQTEQKVKREKKEHRSQHRACKETKPRREKKTPAPQPPNISNTQVNYSSDTLESSISRSSGPPPYTEELMPNERDGTGNTSFGKPVETSSWDLVSQHRQQLSKPLGQPTSRKGTVLDLGYHVNTKSQVDRGKDNSVV